MNNLHRVGHLSIVWGVTLAVITLVEWRSLDRNPLDQQIFLPFIQRHITLAVEQPASPVQQDFRASNPLPPPAGEALQYEVEFHFNGILFLACFFVPILAFHAIGWLLGLSAKKS